MKERPILFSAPMVSKLLSGDKTQTRRIAKVRDQRDGFIRHGGFHGACDDPLWWSFRPHDAMERVDGKGDPLPDYALRCPYGVFGDRLWVKETWKSLGYGRHFGVEVHYAADGYDPHTDYPAREKHRRIFEEAPNRDDKYRPLEFGPWKSPLFMPRWASRITLEITDIRVDRLQDISEADAKAEGISAGDWVWGIEFRKVAT